MSGFVLACLVASAIGAVTARLMRVAGLVLVLGLLVLGGILAMLADLPVPTLLQTLVVMALVQAGYLGGVLFWPAPERRASNPAPLARQDDRKAG